MLSLTADQPRREDAAPMTTAVPRPPPGGLPEGARVVLDGRTSAWARRALLLGGSPWRVLRLGEPARDLLIRLQEAGAAGVEPVGRTDRAVADRLVERGFAHPVAVPRPPRADADVAVVVPAYGRPEALAACLGAVAGAAEVVVVDDASPDPGAIRRVAAAHGARLGAPRPQPGAGCRPQRRVRRPTT